MNCVNFVACLKQDFKVWVPLRLLKQRLKQCRIAPWCTNSSKPSSTLCQFKVKFPVYNGTGDFESWKQLVDRLFCAHKIDLTLSDALAWTLLHLRSSALIYAENEAPADFPALFRLLQQRFQPFDEVYNIRARLNRHRQNGSEYEQYYRRFSDLTARAPDLSNADAQFFFKQDLPAPVRAEIISVRLCEIAIAPWPICFGSAFAASAVFPA